MPITYKLVCVIAILLIHSNSTVIEPSKAQGEEVIIYALPYFFNEYSIFTQRSYATAQWTSAVYASLIKRSSANNRYWYPDLGESMPIISEDGLTFTFELKDNLFFSNGDPLTVDDIEFSMKASITPDINLSSYSKYADFLDNNSMTIISGYRFAISLTQISSFPYSVLSFRIVPKDHFIQRYENCLTGVAADCIWDAEDGSDAISAGPYMVNDIDNMNEIVTVEANPNWHDAALVRTDKFIFQKIADKNAAISSLADGSIHIMDSQYVPGLTEFDNIDGITEAFVGDPATHELAINHKHPYFGTGELIPNSTGATDEEKYENARLLRKAMSLIMDRNSYVTDFMDGLAGPAATTMPSASIGWDPEILPDPYDLEAARSIMEGIGFNYTLLGTPDETTQQYPKSFFNLTLLKPNTSVARFEWSDEYKSKLPTIGIGVKQFVETGWAEVIPRTFGSENDPLLYDEGGYDVFFVGYSWSMDWNPSGLFEASGSCSTGSCENFYNFDLSENITPIANAVKDYLSELDLDSRLEKVQTVQELLAFWLPVIPILYPQSHWGWSSDVTGIDSLLISASSQEWDQVYRTGFVLGPPQEEEENSSKVLIISFPFIYFIIVIPIIISIFKVIRRYKSTK